MSDVEEFEVLKQNAITIHQQYINELMSLDFQSYKDNSSYLRILMLRSEIVDKDLNLSTFRITLLEKT